MTKTAKKLRKIFCFYNSSLFSTNSADSGCAEFTHIKSTTPFRVIKSAFIVQSARIQNVTEKFYLLITYLNGKSLMYIYHKRCFGLFHSYLDFLSAL